MMAAAVATDGKNSSDSESDEEMIPDVAGKETNINSKHCFQY